MIWVDPCPMVDQVFNSLFSLPFPPPFHGSLSVPPWNGRELLRRETWISMQRFYLKR